MSTRVLEIAAFTIDAALKAQQAGADRIELCENPADGGTTPSYGMLKKIRQCISIPVFPIIRPRGGDFVYSDDEFDVMKLDVLLCKDLGFEGIVFGILNEQGDIDLPRMKELVDLAQPMQVTCHRAFDRTHNPIRALEDLIACGCTRILTSGQFPSVAEGAPLIKKLIQLAAQQIIIMPGSGLNSKNVKQIAEETGAIEFHTAARRVLVNEKVHSPQTMQEQLSSISCDVNEVHAIKQILNSLQ